MLWIARSYCTNAVKKLYSPSVKQLVKQINRNNVNSKYEEALKKFEGRVLFNSVLEVQSVRLRMFDEINDMREKREQKRFQAELKTLPIVLSQLCETVSTNTEADAEDEDIEDPDEKTSPRNIIFPYSRFVKVEKSDDNQMTDKADRVPKNWLQDYELYDEAEDEIESTYGTPDPDVPVSSVPCSGCGAQLHCKNASIPGYLPSELFVGLTKDELKTTHCQRCHFLVNYNTAINVTVTPEDYINIISTIKEKCALAVVMVDLLDFPCSIFPDLKELLGAKRPIFIVGNKVDLIPRDQPNYLNHIKNCLRKEAIRMGFEKENILHVSLISATTGYGVEELITKLQSTWMTKGDVYLIGCTNVGKSSLFNSFLRSDFCKVEAGDLIQRATTCPWPGTTLNMLKFPIMRPSDIKLAMRAKRLATEKNMRFAEDQLRRVQANATKDVKYATLIGHIGRTFEKTPEDLVDPVAHNHQSGYSGKIFTLNEHQEKYAMSKWCYDTPGVIQHDQILHLLTTDEILKTIPDEMIRARAFLMQPNFTLFLGGLGRLDFLDGPEKTRVLVFSSLQLPVSIVETKDADEFYESFLGSEILGVPMFSSEDRLEKWPKLEAAYEEIIVEGQEKHLTVCDILLSSAGWIGINLPKGFVGKFKAWTPEKRGIHVRNPSLLPHGMNLRGKRVRRSVAYRLGKAFTFKRPQ